MLRFLIKSNASWTHLVDLPSASLCCGNANRQCAGGSSTAVKDISSREINAPSTFDGKAFVHFSQSVYCAVKLHFSKPDTKQKAV